MGRICFYKLPRHSSLPNNVEVVDSNRDNKIEELTTSSPSNNSQVSFNSVDTNNSQATVDDSKRSSSTTTEITRISKIMSKLPTPMARQWSINQSRINHRLSKKTRERASLKRL